MRGSVVNEAEKKIKEGGEQKKTHQMAQEEQKDGTEEEVEWNGGR